MAGKKDRTEEGEDHAPSEADALACRGQTEAHWAKTVPKRYEIDAKGVLVSKRKQSPNWCKTMECMRMSGRDGKQADCWQS